MSDDKKKRQYIFPLMMALIMAFIMSGMLTPIYHGFSPDFLKIWMRSFIVAWPCASVAVFAALPVARWCTDRIIAQLEK